MKLELLALTWAVTEKFKDYLYGSTFEVWTDNNALSHLQTARLNATEQRWVARLNTYDFQLRYRSGRKNANADTLSRRIPRELKEESQDEIGALLHEASPLLCGGKPRIGSYKESTCDILTDICVSFVL